MVASLMHSPLWEMAGWVMLHFLWVGAAIGLVADAGRRWWRTDPQTRYAFALGCFATLACAPVVIFVCLNATRPPAAPFESAVPGAVAAIPLDAPPVPEGGLEQRPPLVMVTAVVRWLPLVWLIGAPGTFLILATGVIGSERWRRHTQSLEQHELGERCRRLASALGVRGHVALGLCARLGAPILVGIIKPMILLPPAALNGWSIEQVEMVLLHELAHVRRWDNLVNLLQRLVEATLFFHPVVWWLSAWVCLEREMCCDQMVIARTGAARAYAETLAMLARIPRLPAGSSAMGEHDLVIRIRRILNLEDQAMKVSSKPVAFATALLVVVLAVLGFSAADDHAKKPAAGEIAGSGDRKGPEKGAPADEGAKGKPGVADKGTNDDVAQEKPARVAFRGLVEPAQQAQIYGRVAGIVKNVLVHVGDRVKQGQKLVELEVPDAELELKQRAALVQQARAETEQAAASVAAAAAALESAKALVLEAEAGIKGAIANYKIRKEEFEHTQNLEADKLVGPSGVRVAREKLDAAQAAQAGAEAKWKAAQATVEENRAKVARVQAEVQVARAHVTIAEVGMQRAQALAQAGQILAPFDGVITVRAANVGDLSMAGGQAGRPLLSIARTDLVRFVFKLPQAEIAKYARGARAVVEIDALPGKSLDGRISRLAPALDVNTGTLSAEIELRNDLGILPGMTGTARLGTRE